MQRSKAFSTPRACSCPSKVYPDLSWSRTYLLLWLVSLLACAALALSSLMSLAVAAEASSSAASQPASQPTPQPTPQRQQELVRFVRQECGFCHGLHLTGGLGSPLTKDTMADKPAETLEAVILYGIPGTAMPGWRPFISEPETRWIVRALQEGFPYEPR